MLRPCTVFPFGRRSRVPENIEKYSKPIEERERFVGNEIRHGGKRYTCFHYFGKRRKRMVYLNKNKSSMVVMKKTFFSYPATVNRTGFVRYTVKIAKRNGDGGRGAQYENIVTSVTLEQCGGWRG